MTTATCPVCGIAHAPEACCASGPDPRIGGVVAGKYEIVRKLGQGGMGAVYEARHREIGRRVAVKFLLPQFAQNPDILRRFETEARAAGGLEHDHIAAVLDVGRSDDGARYLVMEYLVGEDCAGLLEREGSLPVKRAVNIVIQVCRGLDAAHERGIIHRDLKPANLFLCKRADRTDEIKILDFGIAKLMDGTPHGTATGAAIGTAHYMSPEQARGAKDIDQRSDVYALGVILYELLSGKRPHEGATWLEIVHAVLTKPPARLETLRPGLPAGLPDIETGRPTTMDPLTPAAATRCPTPRTVVPAATTASAARASWASVSRSYWRRVRQARRAWRSTATASTGQPGMAAR